MRKVLMLMMLTSAIIAVTVLLGCWKKQDGSADNILVDRRDRQEYRTVKIGNLIWMAENLNYATGDSRCYGDADSNCVKYGRLYTWDEAMAACPAEAGWRVPAREDWDDLIRAVGGMDSAAVRLRSKTGWKDSFIGNGTDDFGFSALPGGSHNAGDGFRDIGFQGALWGATEYSAYTAMAWRMGRAMSQGGKDNRNSVRCVAGDVIGLASVDTASAYTGAATASVEAAWERFKFGDIPSVYTEPVDAVDAVEYTPPAPGSQFNPNINYGSFTDPRDGRRYRTVKIGNQTWMAENLNFNASGSWCYDSSPDNCAKYGRLYDWATAMGFGSGCNSRSCASRIRTPHQGVCPPGWHVPSDAEWTVLLDFVGGASTAGTKLKTTTGWYTGSGHVPGTDDFGFSALPGGHRYSLGDLGAGSSVGFGNAGINGHWWSTTEYDAAGAKDWAINWSNADMTDVDECSDYGCGSGKNDGFSVRCLEGAR